MVETQPKWFHSLDLTLNFNNGARTTVPGDELHRKLETTLRCLLQPGNPCASGKCAINADAPEDDMACEECSAPFFTYSDTGHNFQIMMRRLIFSNGKISDPCAVFDGSHSQKGTLNWNFGQKIISDYKVSYSSKKRFHSEVALLETEKDLLSEILRTDEDEIIAVLYDIHSYRDM